MKGIKIYCHFGGALQRALECTSQEGGSGEREEEVRLAQGKNDSKEFVGSQLGGRWESVWEIEPEGGIKFEGGGGTW